MIKSFSSMLHKNNAYDVAVHVGKQTNIVKELFNDKSTEGLQRYENIQELLNSIKEWVDDTQNRNQIDDDGVVIEDGPHLTSPEGGGTANTQSQLFNDLNIIANSQTGEDSAMMASPSVGGREGAIGAITLGSYLQQITLLTDADNKDPNTDSVKLMTIHAAKGLEFGCVFAAGLEEMLFPNAMSINTREELEEERRLFYVVITRAKTRLWITYANTRYKFGQIVQNEPSRFLDELPEEHIDKSFAGGGMKNQSAYGGSAFERMKGWGTQSTNVNEAAKAEKRYGAPPGKKPSTPSYLTPTNRPQTIEHKPAPDFVASDTSNLQEGQKVEHQKFGFGEVMKMEGSAHNPIATVKFELNGEKKIMLNYAKLRIVSPL
jgi:DNA helicase-2/ATP-dependent DNA helicase PcrA